MRFFTNFVVISLLFSFPLSAFSQFTVTDLSTTAMTPSALATALSSSSVQVTNVSIQGNPQQFGYFNGNTGTSLSSGVILSTGNVNDAALSNISTSTTTQYNTSGEPSLATLTAYNLMVLDANNCSKSLDFYVDDVVNTSNLMDRKNIKIYPNPANNFINIEMNLKDKQLTNLKLFSVEGKLILQQNQFDFNGNTVKVLTDNLSEGLYFLQLTIDNQEVNQKILVLH